MAIKQINGRQLRHKAHEESLAPGESLLIKKKGGKVFELKRVDQKRKDFVAEMDKIFKEIPIKPSRRKMDLVRIFLEDRW
jgi:hypothetical protein